MNIAKQSSSYTCIRCLYIQSTLRARFLRNVPVSRGQSTDSPQTNTKDDVESKSDSEASEQGQAEGRMAGRLMQMTDELIEQGGRSAKRAIEEGGFSEELKKKLEARLQESSFKSENTAAFAQASLPVRSGHLII